MNKNQQDARMEQLKGQRRRVFETCSVHAIQLPEYEDDDAEMDDVDDSSFSNR